MDTSWTWDQEVDYLISYMTNTTWRESLHREVNRTLYRLRSGGRRRTQAHLRQKLRNARNQWTAVKVNAVQSNV